MFCNNTHSCDVVINEDNTFGSLLNEFLHKHKGIEHLSIEKDTQFLFECTVIKSVEYLIDFLVGRNLLKFHRFKPLEDACILYNKLTHGMECIVNAYGHFNSNI